jgi:hypothetical protein
MGWADGVNQGITCFFLQAFALHCADDKPKSGVFPDQGAIGALADGEQGFSHASNIRAWLASAIDCFILTATERATV